MVKQFVDVGANTGQTFDLFLLPHLEQYADYHVVCVEPSPRHLAALLTRVAQVQSKFASVTVLPFALGAQYNIAPFYEKNGPLADSLVESWRANLNQHRLSVAVVPIVPLLTGDCITIKIDAEGAEYEILSNLYEYGPLQCVERLMVEWHDVPGAEARAYWEQKFAAGGRPIEEWPF